MLTIITESIIKAGNEAEWDTAFETRLRAAKQQPGWLATQVLIPATEPQKRIIIGTWSSREDWERWHQADPFRQTRQQLDAADQSDGQERWFTVHSMASAKDND
jgi:heme-degrading monooxygenase HmoA